MPLFVPLLKLFMLFLNVWDTFKTLKPPPVKYRNGQTEGPSARAVSQRKRDLKGCLAVWIVWCCFSVYERHVEPIVSIFIPFYDEFKGLVVLFLILTRARGAEPIFLHILRPLLKPYTKTLDGSLELIRLMGDILFALVVLPLKIALPWLRAYIPYFHNFNTHSSATSVTLPNPWDAPANRAVELDQTFEPQLTGDTAVRYDLPSQEECDADMEWRRYPELPSAYPPTPLATSVRLPKPNQNMAPNHAIWNPPVLEEEEEEEEYNEDPGFGIRGLSDDDAMRGRDNINVHHFSGFAVNASGGGDDMDIDEGDNVDSSSDDGDYQDDDGDDEEDDFNVTLRTPKAPLPLHPSASVDMRSTIRARASARSIFADMERQRQEVVSIPLALESPTLSTRTTSQQSTSTRLTTNDAGSSLRTPLAGNSASSSSDSLAFSISSGDIASRSESEPERRKDGLLKDLAELDKETKSDSSSSIPINQRGRKRSHSRSFSPERVSSLKTRSSLVARTQSSTRSQGPATSAPKAASSSRSRNRTPAASGSDHGPLQLLSSASTSAAESQDEQSESEQSIGSEVDSVIESGQSETDYRRSPRKKAQVIRAQQVPQTRKRRKVVEAGVSAEPTPRASRVIKRPALPSAPAHKDSSIQSQSSKPTHRSSDKVSAEGDSVAEGSTGTHSGKDKGKGKATAPVSRVPLRKKGERPALKGAATRRSSPRIRPGESVAGSASGPGTQNAFPSSAPESSASDAPSVFPLHVARARRNRV